MVAAESSAQQSSKFADGEGLVPPAPPTPVLAGYQSAAPAVASNAPHLSAEDAQFYRDVFTTQQSLERQLARAKQHVALMQQANVALSEAICGPLGIMSLLPPPLDPRRLNASVLQFLFTAARCLRTNAPIDRYAALHHIEADVFEDAASEFNYPKLLLSSQQSTTTQQAAATNATVLATDDCAMACGTDGHGEMLPHDDIMSPVSESPLSVSEAEEGEIFNDDNAADDFMD
ncbi:hypothetical protein CYMTET_50398 [Cymbomonas tetramitiformis]|uniref:Uncharacterized protein n=1 Tax=Cymbomonas tetramitiformis TaxID=36881 RepID=A0AAE0EUT5_9CHLO|nr:hypothetical protein CYMTET_50398 [Cymbomonas tetramitiformis]